MTTPVHLVSFRRAGFMARWACLLSLLCGAVEVRATSVVPPEFDQLVQQADFVVRAAVKSVNSEWRTNAHGRHIITKVELDVKEVITGTPPTRLVLEMLGGRVGDEELEIQGAPKFAVGDEDILFVRGNGRQFYPLVAIMHGRYPIKRHPQTGQEFLARSNGEPLTSESDVAKPMVERSTSGPRVQAAQITPSALTPAEFSSRIRASAERGKLSQHAN